MSSVWSRAACLVAVVFSLAFVPAANAAPLRLDAGFGEGGIARVSFRVLAGFYPVQPVRQPDGKVLVAASNDAFHGNSEILIARFTRTGRPDPTFGHRGRERLGLGWNFDPTAVHVQRDGRILVLGAAGYGPFFYPSPGQLGLVRLLPDGSRDPTFGTNGFVAWNPPWQANTQSLYALPGLFVPQGDGKVLAAGVVNETRWSGNPYTSIPVDAPRRVAFVRFNRNGSVDESFGHAGVREELAGSTDVFYYAWADLPDGDLVTLATRNEQGSRLWWLHRFTADGTLDQGFGQNGSVRLGVSVLDAVSELLPARDGSLLVLGTVDPANRPGRQRRSVGFCPGGSSMPASARPVVDQVRTPVRWEEWLPQTAAYSRPPGGLSDTRASIASSSATARTAVLQVGLCP
jgi:uncharacterized delta-60 repeat protein